jgi:glycosyltransferase involved in cell wall biosynthesis
MSPETRLVLHAVSLAGHQSFGIGEAVLNLVSAQKHIGISGSVWSNDSGPNARCLEREYGLPQETLISFPMRGFRRYAYTPRMENAIRHLGNDYSIFHQHALWTGISRVALAWRRRRRAPYVIAPHGSLCREALRKSYWKKRIILTCYEQRNLAGAACIHALSQKEAQDIRALGIRNPVAVIPNGISREWLEIPGDSNEFRRSYDIDKDMRILLFLGRITPMKGLSLLIGALSKLRPKLRGWMLVIAGVDEHNYGRVLQSLVNANRLSQFVRIVGPLYGEAKRNAYAAADLFVLPSLTEGSPVVVLEALGAGIPVIVTQAASWSDLVTNRCGWWPAIQEECLAESLDSALGTEQDTLRKMGSLGKILVREKYLWETIASRTAELYNWLLGVGYKPGFVMED